MFGCLGTVGYYSVGDTCYTRYKMGTILYSHVVRVSTHVISLIINIEQMVDQVSGTLALSSPHHAALSSQDPSISR